MSKEQQKPAAIKSRLHPNNPHRSRYDFDELVKTTPALASHISLNKYNDQSIDFADPVAVKTLNTALLAHFYQIKNWDIPEGFLCPPIPGRADYIHHIADLLRASNFGKKPKQITVLDIGVGANCIYPIIGVKAYGWKFIGSDVDQTAITSANNILDQNPELKTEVELILQPEKRDYFYNIIRKEDRIDLSICNPPFHASLKDAEKGSKRKVQNLTKTKVDKPTLNFGGQNNELWCDGGEKQFIYDMIRESKKFGESCFWFSTLVSKSSNLKGIYETLKKAEATKVETIAMGQGNKSSRIVAWTFLNKEERLDWIKNRW